jgi:FMN phosphatase YigB (HAD superfamily)
MSLTVLFDLDDTLLFTNMDKFLPAYFNALSKYLSHLAPKEKIIQQIQFAVRKMAANQNPAKLLKQIFSDNFYKPLGTTEADCREALNSFYEKEFAKLQSVTQQKPAASELVHWCQENNMTLAIATNPLFPETATRQRIEWAGLNPGDFFFFSTYNDFHFTKPNLTYYAETLGRLGWPDEPTVMIGDHLSFDLLPMEKMGFDTYWIDPETEEANRPQGTLAEVMPWLKQVMVKNNPDLANDPEVLLAILRSTPAVIDTWLKQQPENFIHNKPSKQEWSILEVIWHMADMEREVYQPQWEQLLSDPTTGITPVNTSTWAESRKYQDREPEEALFIFLESRCASLALIKTLWEKGLFEISVQHSIFSEATVSELVSFSAKHDRLHLHQCTNCRNFYKIY